MAVVGTLAFLQQHRFLNILKTFSNEEINLLQSIICSNKSGCFNLNGIKEVKTTSWSAFEAMVRAYVKEMTGRDWKQTIQDRTTWDSCARCETTSQYLRELHTKDLSDLGDLDGFDPVGLLPQFLLHYCYTPQIEIQIQDFKRSVRVRQLKSL